MLSRAIVTLLERELESWPGVSWSEDVRRSGRPSCVLSYNGSKRFVIAPVATSTDPRAPLNFIRDMREQLRIMGAVHRPPPSKPKTKEKNELHKKPPPLKPTPPPDGVSDPRSGGLAALADVMRNEIAAAIASWRGAEVVAETKKEAALELLQTWHPDIIVLAARWVSEQRLQSSTQPEKARANEPSLHH